MPEDHLHEHIAAAASRTEREMRSLIARIVSHSWPAGAADRSEPAALEWIRRWRPTKLEALPPACSCAVGRCAVCN